MTSPGATETLVAGHGNGFPANMDLYPPRPTDPDRTLSVAPMMERTDRHFRSLIRCLTKRTLLYTEMIPLGAILHRPPERTFAHDASEHPLALQVGGSCPSDLAKVARLAETWGFAEINLNCGCPSRAVQDGGFGVALMEVPHRVAEAIRAMCESTSLPVTVKTRIGLDGKTSDGFLDDFVGTVAEAGCRTFAVHARMAWLGGLSPKANRTVPPLNHDRVRRLALARPDLEIVVNGGITSLEEAGTFLSQGLGGVMVGRAAWDHPWLFAEADHTIFGDRPIHRTREQVLDLYLHAHVHRERAQGTSLRRLSRPLAGLYRGFPGARRWRRTLSEAKDPSEWLRNAPLPTPRDAPPDLLLASTEPRGGRHPACPSVAT